MILSMRWDLFCCQKILKGEMIMKNVIVKWRIRLDDMERVHILPKEVSRHAPINRVLDQVGFYALDSILIHQTRYLIVFKPEELQSKKSIILVSKIIQVETKEMIVDMTEEDLNNIEDIADYYLRHEKKLMN